MFSYGFYLVFTIFVRNLYGIANAFKNSIKLIFK